MRDDPTGTGRPGSVALATQVWRGARGRCPACGLGRLFGRFLKPRPACEACGQQFHHHRADDFPPYVVMFVVGHICGYGIYWFATGPDEVPMWIQMTVWPALALILSLALIQPAKGAVIGLQFGLGMHGFGNRGPDAGSRRPVGYECDHVG